MHLQKTTRSLLFPETGLHRSVPNVPHAEPPVPCRNPFTQSLMQKNKSPTSRQKSYRLIQILILSSKGGQICLWQKPRQTDSKCLSQLETGPRCQRARPSAFAGRNQQAVAKETGKLLPPWLQAQPHSFASNPKAWKQAFQQTGVVRSESLAMFSSVSLHTPQPANKTPEQKYTFIQRHYMIIPLRQKDGVIFWLGTLITQLSTVTEEMYLMNLQFYLWSQVLLAWTQNGERAMLNRKKNNERNS